MRNRFRLVMPTVIAIAGTSLLATPAIAQEGASNPTTTCPSAGTLLTALTNDAANFEAAGRPISVSDVSCALPYATVTTPASENIDSSFVLFTEDSAKGWTVLNVATGTVCDESVPAELAAKLIGCEANDSSGDDLPDLPDDDGVAAAGRSSLHALAATDVSDVGGSITRAEVMQRAQGWIDNQPGPYSKSGAKSWDPTHTRTYRRDCSGYVDMAWHLNSDQWTGNLSQVADQISRSELKAGDILNDPQHHVVIFKNWKSDKHHFVYDTFGSTPVKERTADIASGTIDSHPASGYIPMRYTKIVEPAKPNPPQRAKRTGDYNGDGLTDRAFYRPSEGKWYVHYQWTDGTAIHPQLSPAAGDVPVPGDYNGDGTFDRAVRGVNGDWKVTYYGSNGTAVYHDGGKPGDIPVAGDYNGDGKYDRAYYRPSEGKWYIHYQWTDGTAIHPQLNPAPGDVPVSGDFNGDGTFDRAVRGANGDWKVTYYGSNGTAIYHDGGKPGDIATAGDYNADGLTDRAYYRPSEGKWYIHYQWTDGTAIYPQLNPAAGDVPAPGDYNGDGKFDRAVRGANGDWKVTYYGSNGTAIYHDGGKPGDIPVTQ